MVTQQNEQHPKQFILFIARMLRISVGHAGLFFISTIFLLSCSGVRENTLAMDLGGFVVGFFLTAKFDHNHMLIPVVDRPCFVFFLLHAAKVRSSCEEGPGQSALQSAYHYPKLDVTELKQNRTP